tara:strand:+ start:1395 stop:1868 length:474 start_codon:yes stop_codon:yes gene_type:complete
MINMSDIQGNTLESVILRQTKDGIFLESVGRVAVLKIRYEGNIKATFSGKYAVGMNKQEILIAFTEVAQKPFLKAVGRYKFKRAKAYSLGGDEVNVRIIVEDDKIQTMRTEWDTSDSKYEDLSYAYDAKRVRKSSITYLDGDREVTVNDKGKRIRSK